MSTVNGNQLGNSQDLNASADAGAHSAGSVKTELSPVQNGLHPSSDNKVHKSSKSDSVKHKHKDHKHKDMHHKSSLEKKEHKNHHSSVHKEKTKDSNSSKTSHCDDNKHRSKTKDSDQLVKPKHDCDSKHISKSKVDEVVKPKNRHIIDKDHKQKDGLKQEKSHKEREKHKHKTPNSTEKHKTKSNSVKSEAQSGISHRPHDKESKAKEELLSEDELPLSARKVQKEGKGIKRERGDESDDEPLAFRAEKVKKHKPDIKPVKKRKVDDEEFEVKPNKKLKENDNKRTEATAGSSSQNSTSSPKKRGKQKEEPQDVWKWWEEEKRQDGVKWKTLSHKGPVFAPNYERLPKNVHFYYDGKVMQLSEETEEVAGYYARMLDHDYTTKDAFNKNFFKDWRKVMTSKERETITDLKKCTFHEINDYYKVKSEERKAMTKDQKAEIKKFNEEQQATFGFCIIDGHKQKIGNFKIEPPGLFRGRGEHPKMGMLKRRVRPEDVIINIGKEAEVPRPPNGHKWKEVRHDNSVTWLACWSENILGQTKYIMLNPSSKLKGEKDWQKYETARKLKNFAEKIRSQYRNDWKSKEMKIRQRSVALYFIDKLALRAGNEKEEGETADTVGCCSLRVEHIKLYPELNGKENVVEFDFLGKDSIRYVNTVSVEKRVYKNLKLFMENKQPGDDLFDRLNTSILNKYLNDLMEGLTAKVFRTYNASKTLQEQLDLLTKAEMSIPEKLLAYNRANRAVAILCNHQRSVPKTFDKQMENLQKKIQEKEEQLKECKKEVKKLKQASKASSGDRKLYEKKKKRLQQLEEQMMKLEVQATDKEENKQIALGTSKLNYLDPRISVAWCKKWDVPIEKIYNRTQRDKFLWAIEMAGPEFKF